MERVSTPIIIGHRGAALRAPENTLASFRRALADGADGIECDVHLSSDGHVVVMHDETIDRTAAATSALRAGALADLTRAQLDEVLLAEDERVPSLGQLLALLDEHDASHGGTAEAYVEVKAPAAAEAVGRLLEGRAGATVISFHDAALAALRAVAPSVPVALIVERVDEGVPARLDELGAPWLSVDVEAVTREDVERAHAAGRRVNVWTANTEAQLRHGIEVGADSISTDDPGWARGVLGGATARSAR